MKRVAIGIRMHSGRGALVAVAMNARDIDVIERSMAKMGRALGPPWTTDQKAAALAACLVLAKTKSGS